jgi:DNA-formamidopyrimidine glycosylase
MPELPEVETTLRGIAPHIINQTVCAITVRQPKLRWQIPSALPETLRGLVVRECRHRAKYLLIRFDTGVLLIHLGMSGSLRIWQQAVACNRVRAFGHTPYLQSHKTRL